MQYLRISVLLVVFCSPLGALAQQDWASMNRSGVQAFRAREYSQAETLFRGAIKAASDLPPSERELARAESTGNLAAVFQVTRRYPDSASHYKKAMRLYEQYGADRDPRLSDTIAKLALLYTQMLRYNDA